MISPPSRGEEEKKCNQLKSSGALSLTICRLLVSSFTFFLRLPFRNPFAFFSSSPSSPPPRFPFRTKLSSSSHSLYFFSAAQNINFAFFSSFSCSSCARGGEMEWGPSETPLINFIFISLTEKNSKQGGGTAARGRVRNIRRIRGSRPRVTVAARPAQPFQHRSNVIVSRLRALTLKRNQFFRLRKRKEG